MSILSGSQASTPWSTCIQGSNYTLTLEGGGCKKIWLGSGLCSWVPASTTGLASGGGSRKEPLLLPGLLRKVQGGPGAVRSGAWAPGHCSARGWGGKGADWPMLGGGGSCLLWGAFTSYGGLSPPELPCNSNSASILRCTH